MPARGLCGECQRPDLFKKLPKCGLRRHTHGSIRVQEGAPTSSRRYINSRLCNSSRVSRGVSIRHDFGSSLPSVGLDLARQALELELLKWALKHAPTPKKAVIPSSPA